MVNFQSDLPLYELSLVQSLVRTGAFTLANSRARTSASELGWDSVMLMDFVCALKKKHFHRRYPKTKAFDGRKEFDTDGYKMRFNEDDRREGTSTDLMFWIKIAIEDLGTNERVAIVSFHLDGQP